MPNNFLWIEYFFRKFPIDQNNLSKQLVLRFGFLLLIWSSGLLSFGFEGQLSTYVSNQFLFRDIFITSFIILFGAYWVQRSLDEIVPKLRKIIKGTDEQFSVFSNRIKTYSYSVKPVIALATFFFIVDILSSGIFQQILEEGLRISLIWIIFYRIFSFLLVGTAYWMFASIWLTIFLVSQQPLNIRLTSKPIEQFNDLSRLALFFSLFYFIAISIVIMSSAQPLPSPISILDIIISPNFFYLLIGVIGVLFPFYSIHLALLKLKKIEFDKLKKESEDILNELDEILINKQKKQGNEEIIDKMARLISIQTKEKQIKDIHEWPIDTSFISRFSGVVLIPVVARISLELINRFF